MDDVKNWAIELKKSSEKLAAERDELTLAMDTESRELQKLGEKQSEKQQLISQHQTRQMKINQELTKNALIIEALKERFDDILPEDRKVKPVPVTGGPGEADALKEEEDQEVTELEA